MNDISIKNININNPLYQKERELRNQVLLRPFGIPDNAWEMHDKKSWHFIALEKNILIGCVLLLRSEEHSKKARLLQMAVNDNNQMGIGKKLFIELIAFSKQNDIQEITCHARDNAIRFYEKLGFKSYDQPFKEVGIKHRKMRKLL